MEFIVVGRRRNDGEWAYVVPTAANKAAAVHGGNGWLAVEFGTPTVAKTRKLQSAVLQLFYTNLNFFLPILNAYGKNVRLL